MPRRRIAMAGKALFFAVTALPVGMGWNAIRDGGLNESGLRPSDGLRGRGGWGHGSWSMGFRRMATSIRRIRGWILMMVLMPWEEPAVPTILH